MISSSSLFVYNGAVSPDRTCTATQCAHGDTMIAGVTTSSSSTFTTIQMVEKIGAGAQSGLMSVHAATVAENDFSCGPKCRWGDYGGATPDPVAGLTAPTGKVWLTNEWNEVSTNQNGVWWRTWKWRALQ